MRGLIGFSSGLNVALLAACHQAPLATKIDAARARPARSAAVGDFTRSMAALAVD